ncbi:hypothetical protein LguiB_018314 [Lonicera macranthoides]
MHLNLKSWHRLLLRCMRNVMWPLLKKNVRFHLKTLRKEWIEMHTLFQISGFGWDENMGRITADPSVWEEYTKANRNPFKLKGKVCPYYPELEILFGSDTATGDRAVSGHDIPQMSGTCYSLLASALGVVCEVFLVSGLRMDIELILIPVRNQAFSPKKFSYAGSVCKNAKPVRATQVPQFLKAGLVCQNPRPDVTENELKEDEILPNSSVTSKRATKEGGSTSRRKCGHITKEDIAFSVIVESSKQIAKGIKTYTSQKKIDRQSVIEKLQDVGISYSEVIKVMELLEKDKDLADVFLGIRIKE